MPTSAPHPCTSPGCPTLVPRGQGRCDVHLKKVATDRRNTQGNPYNNTRWRALRKEQLQKEPLCAECARAGKVVAASHCDHVEPHKGDQVKFWAGPFQSLCAPCHSSKTSAEDGGFGNTVIR